ncbi:NAD(P)-binding protein [Rhizoclosmatium globosum]|uniref:NAD(P)-binding protein n=1 Tax=Rhizoclosmatium globosum TaxID=329046 RepID=A0A1Y2CJ19_9FUNG|nr:NAD(P)-binding protein [Rhizoclosmatium globosum]|eukprot:ORY47041.1 NAD(P)-binding protein [Rhizoclosmatium globosum]
MTATATIAVTGASGQLGSLIVKHLTSTSANVVALVRNPSKYTAAAGVTVRSFDYNSPETLTPGLDGITTLVLVSSSEVGKRTAQHKAVIDAAKSSGVKNLLYVSLLHASTSSLILAQEHKATEEYLTESGIETVVSLRNPWYLENWSGDIKDAINGGKIFGATHNAKVAPATRIDLAVAIANAAVRANEGQKVKAVYELAGEAFTLTDFAAEVSVHAGKTVEYSDLAEDKYAEVLASVGVPEGFAKILADSDEGASKGFLYAEKSDLVELLGREPESWKDHVKVTVSSISA